MNDYSSYAERDTFNEALCNLVEEYLQDQAAYPIDTVLAINKRTMEIELGPQASFISCWEVYQIQNLIRNNDDNTGTEVDIDSTYEIASSYFFVR
jgi:hypothetical protein